MTDELQGFVAVTGPRKTLKFGWWATRFMLWLSGIKAYYICPGREVVLPGTRGVIIGGGDDIEPEHYGLAGDAGTKYDHERDVLEMTIIKTALKNDVPMLGICRGAQLINVVLGGTLHQDLRPLRKVTPNRNSIFPIKWVDLRKDSQLANIFASNRFRINSLHNQAVKNVAPDLLATGYDCDNFIQAIEGHSFLFGVQWHPEYMPYSRRQRRLFSALSSAANRSTSTLSGSSPNMR